MIIHRSDNPVEGPTGEGTWFCYYDLTLLSLYLFGTVGLHELNGLLVLAPVFTARRVVPPYLENTPLDHPLSVQSFQQLWDVVSTTLLADGVLRDAQWLVSIGNEVNAYLEGKPDEDPSTPDGPTPAARAETYKGFVDAVIPYIKGEDIAASSRARCEAQADCPSEETCVPVSCPCATGDVACQTAFDLTPFTSCESRCKRLTGDPELVRAVGVSTTWYGFCGFGDPRPECQNPQEDISVIPQSIRDLNEHTDAWIFTYYPAADIVQLAIDHDISETDGIRRQVPLDLGAMNDLAGRSFDKPVFLQEAGYRSDDAELGPPYVHENFQDLFFQELYGAWTVRHPFDETRYLLANGVRAVNVFALYDFNAPAIFDLSFFAEECGSDADCLQPGAACCIDPATPGCADRNLGRCFFPCATSADCPLDGTCCAPGTPGCRDGEEGSCQATCGADPDCSPLGDELDCCTDPLMCTFDGESVLNRCGVEIDSCTLATLGVGLEGADPSFVRQHLCSLGLVSQADFPENPFAPKPAFHTFEAISEGFNPRLRCGSNASCSYGGEGVCRRDGLCVCDEVVCPQGQVCRSPGVCG